MAGPLPCDNHPDQLAVILTTNLEAGETLTLCWPCTLQWAEMLIAAAEAAENAPAEPEPAAEEVANLDTEVFDETLARLRQESEEVADLEPVAPAPDAESKTEPEPAPPPAPKAKQRAKATQETPTPGE